MLQKLTYTGSVTNSYVYFVLYGDSFDPQIVTDVLKTVPTSTKTKTGPIPKYSSWTFKFEAGTELDLAAHLDKIITLLKPRIALINKLKKEYCLESRITFKVDVEINPDESTPYFPLNHEAISFLYLTGTSVDFDLHKTDQTNLLS